jgi:hypothetical protein
MVGAYLAEVVDVYGNHAIKIRHMGNLQAPGE